MHYIESGAGTPLVLLHAFPTDARMWNGARGLLDNHARVITPDQRGLGESPLDGSSVREDQEIPPPVPAPDLDVAAGDLLALLDGLGLDRFVLGGCSMGGYVAMTVLRRAPERVRGLLLADTKAAADTPEQRDGRLAVADRASTEGTTGWLAENNVGTLLGETTRNDRPDVVHQARQLIGSQPASGVAWAQRAMARRPDSSGLLREWNRPTLVVSGEEDTVTPPAVAGELADLLPDAERALVPNSGHLCPLETPEAFANAVINWLSRFD